MMTSEAMNIIWNIYSVLFTCPGQGCYLWGLINNHTQPMGGRTDNGFFQSFRPEPAIFENTEFPLDVRIMLLVLLCVLCTACTVYTVLGVRTVLGMVQHPQEEEKRSKSAGTMSTQTVTEPGQPKPVAVALIQKRKSKSKSVHIVTDDEAVQPSHPAEEMEPEIITWSLSLGELQREFTCQVKESILTCLLCIWDVSANGTILDGSEANWDPCPRMWSLARGLGKPRKLLASGGDCWQI